MGSSARETFTQQEAEVAAGRMEKCLAELGYQASAIIHPSQIAGMFYIEFWQPLSERISNPVTPEHAWRAKETAGYGGECCFKHFMLAADCQATRRFVKDCEA